MRPSRPKRTAALLSIEKTRRIVQREEEEEEKEEEENKKTVEGSCEWFTHLDCDSTVPSVAFQTQCRVLIDATKKKSVSIVDAQNLVAEFWAVQTHGNCVTQTTVQSTAARICDIALHLAPTFASTLGTIAGNLACKEGASKMAEVALKNRCFTFARLVLGFRSDFSGVVTAFKGAVLGNPSNMRLWLRTVAKSRCASKRALVNRMTNTIDMRFFDDPWMAGSTEFLLYLFSGNEFDRLPAALYMSDNPRFVDAAFDFMDECFEALVSMVVTKLLKKWLPVTCASIQQDPLVRYIVAQKRRDVLRAVKTKEVWTNFQRRPIKVQSWDRNLSQLFHHALLKQEAQVAPVFGAIVGFLLRNVNMFKNGAGPIVDVFADNPVFVTHAIALKMDLSAKVSTSNHTRLYVLVACRLLQNAALSGRSEWSGAQTREFTRAAAALLSVPFFLQHLQSGKGDNHVVSGLKTLANQPPGC